MHAVVAGVVAALATYLLTPLAIRLAVRTSFFDLPAGYKGHRQPTPYLGGTAIALGLLTGVAAGGLHRHYAPVVACAVVVWVMGTIDDKVSLPILLRVAVEVAIGVTLAVSGLGWNVFHEGFADGALTVFWVLGVMNAFNLMDNMDGAAATTAAASALGAAAIALLSGQRAPATLCLATAGACVGFLPRNLASPAKIFMGDGGSLPLGLLVAAMAMSSVTQKYLGPNGVVIGALLVGMVIFDTTLVTVSRSRGGRSVLAGGRDHTTHRLAQVVGTPRRVALTLAGSQLGICGLTIAVAQAGGGWVLASGGVGVVFGAVLLWQFETSPRLRVNVSKRHVGTDGAVTQFPRWPLVPDETQVGSMGSRVLVTGCAGFIGSHLAESLLNDDISVVGIDCFNDNYGRPEKLQNLKHLTSWDRFEFTPIDLARGSLEDVVVDCDLIFHLAAEPGVRTSWGGRYEQYLRNNVLATQHLLEALRQVPDTRFVYASSSSVYGDSETRPTPESATLCPRSPYGQTKAAMEYLCDLYRMNFGVETVGLRYFTVFGPRQRPDMAFHRICRAALEETEFVVFGDGRQTRDFSYVGDIVSATRAAALAPLGEERIFNVGGGSPASLRDAIEIVSDLAESQLAVRYEESERGDVRDTAADTTLARTVLGFTPTVGLADGLEAQFDWLSAHLAEQRV